MKHLSKLIWINCLAMSLATAGRPAVSQEPVAESKPTDLERVSEATEQLFDEIDEKSLTEVPKRDFKVQVGPEQQTRLFRADPKLLENKFAATLVLLPSGLNPADEESVSRHNDLRNTDHSWSRQFPEPLQRLREFDNVFLFFPDAYQSSRAAAGQFPKLSQHHAMLIEQCPAEHRPDRRLTEFLTSPDADRDVVRRSNLRQPGASVRHAEWTYTIYAPTAEEAQERAEAIVRLLDCGLSRPMQQYLLAEGRKSLEAARNEFAALAERDAAIRDLEEKAAKPSEITGEILVQLKAQKVMVAIELAGLNARVRACNEMLKENTSLHSSISDMKVRAEVELIGSKEKLDQINTFIAEGSERQKLLGKIAVLKSARSTDRANIRKIERRAEAYARLISLYAPLEIKDNQITISPVEWTN